MALLDVTASEFSDRYLKGLCFIRDMNICSEFFSDKSEVSLKRPKLFGYPPDYRLVSSCYLHSRSVRSLDFRPMLQVIILNDFDPIIVRIQNESNGFHTTICEPLLPLDVHVIKTLACCIKIIN
jgi:hypothetical protein